MDHAVNLEHEFWTVRVVGADRRPLGKLADRVPGLPFELDFGGITRLDDLPGPFPLELGDGAGARGTEQPDLEVAFARVLDLPLPRARLLGGQLSEFMNQRTLDLDPRLRSLFLAAGRKIPGRARARPILNYEGRCRGQHDHDHRQNDPPQHDGMTPAQQTETMKAMMTFEA